MSPRHAEESRFWIDTLDTPVGAFAVVADDAGCLRAAGFTEGHARMEKDLRRALRSGHPAPSAAHDPGGLTSAMRRYFAGDLGALDDVRVVFAGTLFQRAVWQALRTIPVGETRSYGELAHALGQPRAVRAVGLANGANPIAVVVPCHRVIGADGSLTGYGGGLERKRWLLAHEGAGIWREARPRSLRASSGTRSSTDRTAAQSSLSFPAVG